MKNLTEEGLEVETSNFSEDSNILFDKIHSPKDVLRRYGEILKMKMPIKSFYRNARKISAETNIEGTDMLEQELVIQDLPEPPSFYKAYILKLAISQKLQDLLYPNPEIFSNDKNEFTAVYSRAKDFLFDHDDENFFSPSKRTRIVEFLLKRKRFSDDKEDDFAFGINKLSGEVLENGGSFSHWMPLETTMVSRLVSTLHGLDFLQSC